MDMIRAEYIASYGLRIGDREFDETQFTTPYSKERYNKTGVLPSVCRKLIAEGVDPETLIEVYRGDTKCFDPMAVGYWADKTYSEGDRPLQQKKYIPYPSRLQG